MQKKKILFYNDSEVFGGHEMMTSHIMNTLQQSAKYDLCCIRYSDKFTTHLDSSIQQVAINFHSKSRSLNISNLKKIFKNLKPDVIVAAQGYAESGARGLLAGKKCNIPTYSYIPFGYTNAEMRNRHAWLRDLVCKYIYKLPTGYITISDY